MKVLEVQILRFEAFRDSGTLLFRDGINIIVGRNNSGKSSILRALQPDLPDHRNRNPTRYMPGQLRSAKVELLIQVEGTEIKEVLFEPGQIYFPVPFDEPSKQFFSRIFEHTHQIRVVHQSDSPFSRAYPAHGLFLHQENTPKRSVNVNVIDGDLHSYSGTAESDNSGKILPKIWREKLFYISSERQNPGLSPLEPGGRLKPDASNLATVLQNLNGESGDKYKKLVNHLAEVFPTVGNVSVRLVPGNPVQAEIRIWPTAEMKVLDLSFPLSESGTGIAQVLTILTAASTTSSSVILIDELSSFLHPSATKSLLRIINASYAEHQYIITTHSPEVVNFSSPKSVHLVRRSGYETSVESLDLSSLQSFRAVADELGVSMADVFAADHIIWVEGPTEEICFPLLFEFATSKNLPRGTTFISVLATGDFFSKKRGRNLIFNIYERLSTASSVLAVSMKFNFDSELLSQAEKTDAERRSGGRISFLPRRHFECYLINSQAILAFLTDRDSPDSSVYTLQDVTNKISVLAETKYRIDEWKQDVRDTLWLMKVDAANLIADLCVELTDHRVTFNKKEDALFLVKQILHHSVDDVRELLDYVVKLVEVPAK